MTMMMRWRAWLCGVGYLMCLDWIELYNVYLGVAPSMRLAARSVRKYIARLLTLHPRVVNCRDLS